MPNAQVAVVDQHAVEAALPWAVDPEMLSQGARRVSQAAYSELLRMFTLRKETRREGRLLPGRWGLILGIAGVRVVWQYERVQIS